VTAPADRLKGQIGLVVAVSVSNTVAHLCTSALPFQVGALIDGYHFSATSAGLIGFFQVGALAASMILFSPAAHRFRPAWTGVVGMAIAACANVLIYIAPAVLPLICLLATVAGAGYGLVLTAAVAAAAGAERPDRVYAAGNSGALLLLVAMLSLLPTASLLFGAHGIFMGIPLLILLCLPAVVGFRSRATAGAAIGASGVTFVQGLPLLAIWSLFSFGTGAMWAFAERTGRELALSGPTIGLVLSTSVFAGLIGTGLAAMVSGRIKRVTALAFGLVGGGATCLMFGGASSLPIYAAAAILYWVFTMFVYVLLLGTAATLDPSGRLGTLGTGCERLAFAVSAPIGGVMVDLGSTLWVGIGAAVACAIAAPLCLPALARMLDASPAATDRRPTITATGIL